MINCQINLQACSGLPIFYNNKYLWNDGSYLTVLSNPYISSTLFHSAERWICIIRQSPYLKADNKALDNSSLDHSMLKKIYADFSSLDSEGILIELAIGTNGNALRVIASNEGSIPIYFSQNKNTINLNWDFREITTFKQSLIIDYEYLVKSTFKPTYTNRTAFQGISMLTAGSSCTFSAESCEYKYPGFETPLPERINNIDTDNAIDLFFELLKKKVELQIGDASKIAVELSGGLDSSTITVTSALSLQSKNTNTYGILISDPALVRSQKTRRKQITSCINGNDYAVNINDHLPIFASPAMDRYYLNSEAYGAAFEAIWSRAAADGQYAIMNGCGGDELFPQFLEEDFSDDRLRSTNEKSWRLYNQLLNDRLTPKTQDILGSHFLSCAPKKNVDTGMLLAMSRRAPLLLSFNLVPLYPFRDNNIIKLCNSLPLHLRLNKTLLTELLCKKTQSTAFRNYPKETFMHTDKIVLLKQKELIINMVGSMRIVEIGVIEKKVLKRDLERLTTTTPRYILDYLLNILAIERFLRAYL